LDLRSRERCSIDWIERKARTKWVRKESETAGEENKRLIRTILFRRVR
jgi:hypothetical protein